MRMTAKNSLHLIATMLECLPNSRKRCISTADDAERFLQFIKVNVAESVDTALKKLPMFESCIIHEDKCTIT
jgi:hypothetical protein